MYMIGCLQVLLSLHHRHKCLAKLLGFLSIRNLWWIVLVGTTSGAIQLQLSRISRPIEMEHWCPWSEHPCPKVVDGEHWCLCPEHPCSKIVDGEHWCLCLEHPCSKIVDGEHWCLCPEHPCSKIVDGEH